MRRRQRASPRLPRRKVEHHRIAGVRISSSSGPIPVRSDRGFRSHRAARPRRQRRRESRATALRATRPILPPRHQKQGADDGAGNRRDYTITRMATEFREKPRHLLENPHWRRSPSPMVDILPDERHARLRMQPGYSTDQRFLIDSERIHRTQTARGLPHVIA